MRFKSFLLVRLFLAWLGLLCGLRRGVLRGLALDRGRPCPAIWLQRVDFLANLIYFLRGLLQVVLYRQIVNHGDHFIEGSLHLGPVSRLFKFLVQMLNLLLDRIQSVGRALLDRCVLGLEGAQGLGDGLHGLFKATVELAGAHIFYHVA